MRIYLLLSVGFCLSCVPVAGRLEVNNVAHSLPLHQEHEFALCHDGKNDTYLWTERSIKKDETITMALKKPIAKNHTLVVRDGKPDGKDTFSGAVIEASLEGKDWKVIGSRRAGVLMATMPRELSHIRLRATQDTGNWVAIREIEVLENAPVAIYRHKVRHGGKNIPLTLAVNLEGFADLKPAADKMAALYTDVWPRLVEMLGSPIGATHRDVSIVFEEKMGHPAHASGNTITISAAHLRRDPADTEGVFIHELTHVIQRYRGPIWFVEGVADYTRFKLKNDDAWGRLCRRHIPYDKPFGQYWSSAAFLLYLEDTYKKRIVRDVSMSMRANTYTDEIWKKLTGKSLDELAADYKTSGWKPAE